MTPSVGSTPDLYQKPAMTKTVLCSPFFTDLKKRQCTCYLESMYAQLQMMLNTFQNISSIPNHSCAKFLGNEVQCWQAVKSKGNSHQVKDPVTKVPKHLNAIGDRF